MDDSNSEGRWDFPNLQGGRDMPLRAKAYRWDLGKLVSENRKQEIKGSGWGAFTAGSLHARLGVGGTNSCASSSRPEWRDNVSI